MTQKITIATKVAAPMTEVWRAWNTPDDITKWNIGSPDWHTPRATVDLRVGGSFCSRMEAKDGSMGFDFAGTYTKIVENQLIETAFGDRTSVVKFSTGTDGITVEQTFDAEESNPIEMQRAGWQTFSIISRSMWSLAAACSPIAQRITAIKKKKAGAAR